MTRILRVFVDGIGIDVAESTTAFEAVRAVDSAVAAAVAAGTRAITDSRGLAVDPETPNHAGSVYRTVAVRRRDRGGDP